MATVKEIAGVLKTLASANLRFTPADDKLPGIVMTWSKLLTDIPAEALERAALDIILTADEFPTLAQIRKQTDKVRANNGVSAAPSMFKAIPEPKYYLKPAHKSLPLYPPEVQAELDRLEAEIGDGVITAEIHEYISSLTEPYLNERLPYYRQAAELTTAD